MAAWIFAGIARVGLVAAILLTLGTQGPVAMRYLALEMGGVHCGSMTFTTSPLRKDGRTLTLLTQEVVVKGTLLGATVTNRLVLTYHIDPDTNAFTYHESVLEQRPTRLTSAIRIEGRTARVSDGAGGKETAVDLPVGVVLENTLFRDHRVSGAVSPPAAAVAGTGRAGGLGGRSHQ